MLTALFSSLPLSQNTVFTPLIKAVPANGLAEESQAGNLNRDIEREKADYWEAVELPNENDTTRTLLVSHSLVVIYTQISRNGLI